jgi:lipopolysaccharide/colanic/teichoic acid biosynthesis glycosyltransferase
VKHSRRVYDATKRVLDVIVSALLLAVLSPVLLGVAVLVRIRLGSPVLFTQERPGLGGTSFTLYKFRSMREGSGSGIEAVSTDADRLSSFGRLLRASSLDELPELWNVLLGDMSLVGPRPLLTEYLPLYNETQARRHEVRPGITGWAQVNGRNAVEWDDRLRMDVHYVDNRSLALDARVLLMTVATVFARKGVSAEGHATMRPFDPNEPSDKEDS